MQVGICVTYYDRDIVHTFSSLVWVWHFMVGLLGWVRAGQAGSPVTAKGRKLSRSIQLCRDNEELVSRLSSKTGITIGGVQPASQE